MEQPFIVPIDEGASTGYVRHGRKHSNTVAKILRSQESPMRRDVNTPLAILYRLFRSFGMQVIMILLTCMDLSFLLYEFITSDVQYAVATLFTSLMFFLEIVILWSFEGTTQYFNSGSNRYWLMAEVIIVSLSFVVEYVEYTVEETLPGSELSEYLRYLRAIRFLRVLILWQTRHRNFVAALRRLVSADRRRYQKDGYDLDLTYVHPTVIAMSWPSSKAESLYRNQIDTVARFLDEKHFGHYKVYNLCSERSYDESKFHFQTQRFPCDDHNPPELLVMLEFARHVHSFIQESPGENVAVIHCKGGKGRTGTMVCTYLIYAGIRNTADAALSHFGIIRTSDDAKSFQGVESPSQDRYVRYFERLLRLPQQQPPRRVVRLTKFILHNVPTPWWSNGIDRLWFAMISRPSTERRVHFLSNPSIRFDPRIPENPFEVRKQKMKKGGGASPGSPTSSRFTATGNEYAVEPESIYSDDDVGGNSPSGRGRVAATSSYFSLAAEANNCQPFAANLTVFVNGNMSDGLDFETFTRRYVGKDSTGGSNVTALSANPRATPLRDNTTTASSGNNSSLRVSISYDVSLISEFEGDMNIRFFYNVDDPNTLQCPMQTFFHPSFEGDGLYLTKAQIDGPHKEAKKEKKFPKGLAIEVEWETVGMPSFPMQQEEGVCRSAADTAEPECDMVIVTTEPSSRSVAYGDDEDNRQERVQEGPGSAGECNEDERDNRPLLPNNGAE